MTGRRKWWGFFAGLAAIGGLAAAGVEQAEAYWAVVGLYGAFAAGNAGEHLAAAVRAARGRAP